MKKIILILCYTISVHPLFSQIKVNELFNKINWYGTESELVYNLRDHIKPVGKKETWERENSESNYEFSNLNIGQYPIQKSHIRVEQSTKKLLRINLIMFLSSSNLKDYENIKSELLVLFGKPTFDLYGKEKNPVLNENTTIWIYENYKIEAKQIDLSSTTTKELNYAYAINIEPIYTYYVDWKKCKIEGVYNNEIPKFEYFRFDSENNVYFKELNKQEIKKDKVKVVPTPKGNVISCGNFICCYRKNDNDIIYMIPNQDFALIYPITK